MRQRRKCIEQIYPYFHSFDSPDAVFQRMFTKTGAAVSHSGILWHPLEQHTHTGDGCPFPDGRGCDSGPGDGMKRQNGGAGPGGAGYRIC